jgi:hypothetical protein
MVVGCHSGVIPYDAALALVAIEQATGRLARSIGDTLQRRHGVVWSRYEETDSSPRARSRRPQRRHGKTAEGIR